MSDIVAEAAALTRWLFDVALSVFVRAVERLRVFVALTCSFASGVSDVLLMKKTPFYITMRLLGVGNLSSQPQKRAVIFPYWEETDPLVGAVPGIIFVCAHWRQNCYV